MMYRVYYRGGFNVIKTRVSFKLLLIPCLATKIFFTVLFLFGVLPSSNLSVSLCAFSIPFTLASFYDGQFVDKFGLLLIFILFLAPLLWLLSLVLMVFKRKKLLVISCIILIALCLLDIVCAVWSLYLGTIGIYKCVNILFSLFIALVSVLYIRNLKSFIKV